MLSRNHTQSIRSPQARGHFADTSEYNAKYKGFQDWELSVTPGKIDSVIGDYDTHYTSEGELVGSVIRSQVAVEEAAA